MGSLILMFEKGRGEKRRGEKTRQDKTRQEDTDDETIVRGNIRYWQTRGESAAAVGIYQSLQGWNGEQKER
jgi:hypothetical protein